MFQYYIKGFILGLAYLAPIGMQNLYVINSAIKSKGLEPYMVAGITIIFDISLSITCFFGVGAILNKWILFRELALLIGGIVVVVIGIKLLKTSPEIDYSIEQDKNIFKIVLTCFITTWINPQAIIDGSMLLGGFRVMLSLDHSIIFILGVCSASCLWFMGLAALVSKIKYKLNNKILKIINFICGIIIIYYGMNLEISFIKLQFF
ncbi:LysE/ArgO family amino acid transporter [Clostridium felsineum]|uniref:LysE/ArgO family amino acid transporter n=1 Tax=Clostridium felsineum TaxID=36839 RepID=UPI00098C1029|nr:LysE family transporter [Clostridium felsineum]URZ15250.1 Arginine exporter protein ArgO [Clostridium felsineum DSM 794]